MEQNEVVVYPDKMNTSDPLSYDDIRGNTSLVKKALQGVMTKDVDFGLIPGCGNKPSLFKPGAEKLMLMFKLGCFLKVDDQSEPNETGGIIKYVVRTEIRHIPTGRELGIGVGMCSSAEDKYAWRKAVGDKEYDATPEEMKRLKWKAGWKDKPEYAVKQVRTNPHDLANTILKMAAKRSKIDGVLTVTAASDILAQDLEDRQVDNGQPPIQRAQAKPASEPNKEEGAQSTIPAGYREMKSKYDGQCKGCEAAIAVGDTIYYSKEKGTFKHLVCCA